MTNSKNYYHEAPFAIVKLLAVVLCASVVNLPAQVWKTVADGVEYAEVRREFSGKAVNINLLRLDLKKVRLDVHHAMDAAIGTEKTSSIATRHKAFAAINAGFFRLDTSKFAGDSVGVLIVDNKLISESNRRIALLIRNRSDETLVLLDHLDTYPAIKIGSYSQGLNGLNRELKDNELVLFSPSIGPSTLTGPTCVEFIIRKNRIVQINNGIGNSPIPSDGFVLAAGKDWRAPGPLDANVGSRVQVSWYDAIAKNAGPKFVVEDAVAGNPQLIKNSKINITWEQERASRSFVETRHPRTAVAKLKDGKFLMLTADGRSNESAGLDLYDLAAYFLELGATDAMNLDGGGSTTMFLDGKVVNIPSDQTGERKVSDAILVTLRKKPATKKK